MCSISGVLSFKSKIDFDVIRKLTDVITKAESRGRDSFGYTTFNEYRRPRSFKYVGRPTDVLSKSNPFGSISKEDFLIISNNRAEPTTEFVNEKKLSDVQPYSCGNTWVVHNGTIANDRELIQKYSLNTSTRIDSIVIPHIFDRCDFKPETIINILQNELIGSYAMAVYNSVHDKLVLATNYKPLSLLHDKKTDVLYFSSMKEYLIDDDYNNIFKDNMYMEVKPYTVLIIDRHTREIQSYDLYKKKEGKKKALVCASSGMDSTVAASWAIKQGLEVTLLHFEYNCRAQEKELTSIKNIAEYLNCELVTIKVDFFKNVLGGSRLYDESFDITKGGDVGAELAIEWVPARNLIFMSISAGFAEAKEIDYIVLGGNLEESGAFADNELIFQQKFNDLLPNSLNLQNRVQVLTPVADLMKREIVKLGLEINAPLHLTWSCYENGDKHCGQCGPCFMRRTAFKMLNKPEVIEYES